MADMATNPFVRDLPPDANPFMAKPVEQPASVPEAAPPAEQPASVQAVAQLAEEAQSKPQSKPEPDSVETADIPHTAPKAPPAPTPANDDELESPERASDEILAYLVRETRKAKALADEAAEKYALMRTQLWDASGHEVGELPGGAKFRAPSSRRSVDYKVLERKYPEVYELVVRTTEPEAGKPGSLVL
ncbi:hypothetical protein SEA_PUPPERS_57 [Gordonia phage Puppers]|nr:hypothetical protein SEA_PUPPERS_57 [Gordonia phage Puppers]